MHGADINAYMHSANRSVNNMDNEEQRMLGVGGGGVVECVLNG